MTLPKISVIVPVYKEKRINSFLKHLFLVFPHSEVEIIIVDGDSTKSTIKKISPVYSRVVVATAKRGRANQMNKGATMARAAILLFLHADTRLPKNACDVIKRAMQHFRAGGFSLRIDSERRMLKVISWLTTLRSRITRIPYGDQAIFITRELFYDCGKFHNLPVLEDVDLMVRIRKREKIKILNEKVVTSARRWERGGVLATSMKHRLIMLLYFFGFPPQRISTLLKR